MTKMNKNSNVAASIVEAATSSSQEEINSILAPHVKAGDIVMRMEFNLSSRNKPMQGSTINSFGGGGIYKYKANPGKAFMTQCPMGFTNSVKGDPSSKKNYFDNGEWARVVLAAASDEDSEELIELKSSLKDAQAMLKKATKSNKATIECMIDSLKEQINSFDGLKFDHETMTYEDWEQICKFHGMKTGELKLWFPMNWNANDIDDFRGSNELVAVRVYFLLSNVGCKSEEIYPRMSNKNEKDVLLSTNAVDGSERIGLQLTVTPLHMEFLDETFHHTKQLRMADPTALNQAANFFLARDKAKREAPAVVFESLTPIVEQVNIRAKKLPQCQAKLEGSLKENNIWLSHIESELKMIADSNQFFSFKSSDCMKYLDSLKEEFPNAVIEDTIIKESELKKVSINKPVLSTKEPEIVEPVSLPTKEEEEDEVDALLSSLI